MITFMNQYVAKINLISDDLTKNLLIAALKMNDNVSDYSVIVRNHKFIVDIKLNIYTVEYVTKVMDGFVSETHYPYSSFYLRFNEGKQIRYRYASCKEDKEGFYCDIVFSEQE